jgi:heterodisulfide reductase subunit A
VLRYEDVLSGTLREAEHDLVVLSVGVLPNQDPLKYFQDQSLQADNFQFVRQADPLASPSVTSIPGVFVAGTASGPMDIPDSILSAGAASSEAISYISEKK